RRFYHLPRGTALPVPRTLGEKCSGGPLGTGLAAAGSHFKERPMDLNTVISDLVKRWRWGALVVILLLGVVTPSYSFEQPAQTTIQRFVEGVNASAEDMKDDDVKQQLNDPWAVNVLRKGAFPADLNKALDALTGTGLFPEQESFFISESA